MLDLAPLQQIILPPLCPGSAGALNKQLFDRLYEGVFDEVKAVTHELWHILKTKGVTDERFPSRHGARSARGPEARI